MRRTCHRRRARIVAGIDAVATARQSTLDVTKLGLTPGAAGFLIRDGAAGNLSFVRETLPPIDHRTLAVTLAPHGGFVAVLP